MERIFVLLKLDWSKQQIQVEQSYGQNPMLSYFTPLVVSTGHK